jgi:ABC-type lipoprotein release transport system permease subunit
MGKSFKLAWRNMWRNWRRTAIALVAIVLGLVLLIFFDGFIQGSDQAIFGNAVKIYGGNLQVHAPGYRDKVRRMPLLPLENADEVVAAATERPEVIAAAKRINTGGVVLSGDQSLPVTITAIEPNVEGPHSMQAANIAEGRYLLEEEGDAILIGQALADRLGLAVGDRTTLLGHGKHETHAPTHHDRGRHLRCLGAPDLEKSMVFITLPEAQSPL